MRHKGNLRITFEAHIDGKCVQRKRLSRSFVKGFANILYTQMSAGSPGAQNDTGGASRTLSTNANAFGCSPLIDDSSYGIVLGTGTTAVSTGDTKLVTQIATGNGAGQLRYLAPLYNNYTIGGTDTNFQIIRGFVNNSGSTITPTELGIYMRCGSTPFVFCCVRDLFGGGGIVVAAGKTLTVTYTLSFPV